MWRAMNRSGEENVRQRKEDVAVEEKAQSLVTAPRLGNHRIKMEKEHREFLGSE